MKNKYLQMIEDAGFKQVSIKEENLTQAEDMANDPTAQAIAKNVRIPPKEIEKVANSVASVKVSAVKPK